MSLLKTLPLSIQGRLNTEYSYDNLKALCPVDSHTDYYTIMINCIPNQVIFDIYSLKDYLKSYDCIHISQEDLTFEIFQTIYESILPETLEIVITPNITGGIYTKTRINIDDYLCR